MKGNDILLKAESFAVTDGRRVHYGANQHWFEGEWQRKSGCGPTSGAVIARYLAKTREEFRPLYDGAGEDKGSMLALMDAVWQHITPGKMGVNNVKRFADGLADFAASRGVRLSAKFMKVPAFKPSRPDIDRCAEFIRDALSKNMPVAWLNLHRGKAENLSSWHWVTVIGIKEAPDGAVLCTYLDNGQVKISDFRLWLKTSYLGGGLVAPDV